MTDIKDGFIAHRRRSIRLKTFDYAQDGAYFVSVCTYKRESLFGNVIDDIMVLDPPGRVVHDVWSDLPFHYPHVDLDAFVVMPNHVHGIVLLSCRVVGAGFKPALSRRHPLSEILRAFKAFSSRRINALRRMPGTPVWQRNYYEHVIRNEDELERLRRYIADNPARWSEDEENPFYRSCHSGQ